MGPNLQRVAEVGANGRYLIAIALIAMVAILSVVAFVIGRAERRRGNR